MQRTESLKATLTHVLPFLVLGSMSVVFQLFAYGFGNTSGYFWAFVVYWLFWCFLTPLLLLGKTAPRELFRRPAANARSTTFYNYAALALLLALAYSYAFPRALREANALIILSSAGLSIVNATAEEILWRGALPKLLGDSRWSVLYSAFGFALWHLAPLSVHPTTYPGGAVSFLAVSFVLGLLCGKVARDQQSILVPVVFHILFDFSGLGGRMYF